MADMTDIYFDINKFGNTMQIRIFKRGYINNEKYNFTWVSHPIFDNREEFGLIELRCIDFTPIMDSSVPGGVKKYAEVYMAKLDGPMRYKGYGRLLYNKALDEVRALGLDGIASEDNLRSSDADRLYKNCRSIEYRGSTFTIMDGKKYFELNAFHGGINNKTYN